MQHLVFLSIWLVGWDSVALSMLARLPRLWMLLLLTVASWAFVVVLVILVMHEHALLLRAAELMADVHIRP